eukprot:scaffold154296_cov31-Tisochrysis_lutea.AAC.3
MSLTTATSDSNSVIGRSPVPPPPSASAAGSSTTYSSDSLSSHSCWWSCISPTCTPLPVEYQPSMSKRGK